MKMNFKNNKDKQCFGEFNTETSVSVYKLFGKLFCVYPETLKVYDSDSIVSILRIYPIEIEMFTMFYV